MPREIKRAARARKPAKPKRKLTREEREERSDRKQARLFELQKLLAEGLYRTHVTAAEKSAEWGLSYDYVVKLACEAAARNRAQRQTADEIQSRNIVALEGIVAKAMGVHARLDDLLDRGDTEGDEDDDGGTVAARRKRLKVYERREVARVALAALDTATKTISALSGITDLQRRIDDARRLAEEAAITSAAGGTGRTVEVHVHHAPALAPADATAPAADPAEPPAEPGARGAPQPG